MSQKKFIIFIFVLCTIPALACRLSELGLERSTPTSTPTVLVARYTTVTATAEATATAPATSTPVATLAPTLLPSPSASPTPRPSLTPIGSRSTPAATASRPNNTSISSDSITQPPTTTPSPTTTPIPAPSATPAPPSPPPLSGKIAFPIDDGFAHYDIWMVELPQGEPFLALSRARQPNFSARGQLLVNNENSPNGENLGLLEANNTWLGLVSDTPEDRHPFWNPAGDRYVYANPQLLTDPITRNYLAYIFIPCSLSRPTEEGENKCRDTGGMSKLTPGAYPVWTDDNRIAFFADLGGAGIYLINAGATPREFADDSIQRVLLSGDARPSDTQGNKLFFSTASLAQNWEAYVVNLDGSNLVNLSNSQLTNDGLPTVSPDGAWVAFVSNRNEHWGIWIVSSSGGTPFELVDLSKINTINKPWGEGDREWANERITWGP